jgi:hypothetical protein
MSSDAITPEPNPDPARPAATPEPRADELPLPPPNFATQPYAPDGSAPPAGLALTLGGGLAAAVVVGLLAGIIGQWFYLVLLFPLLIGLILGAVGMGLIRVGKLRNPLLAGIAAGLSGVMAMGTMHFVKYQFSLNAAAKELFIDRDELEKQISFAKYLDLRAEKGVTIAGVARNDKGMNLGYVGSYIYWLVEVILVAAVAWMMMRKKAAEPFCVGCNTWKDDRPLAMVMVPDESMAAHAVDNGNVVGLLPCVGRITPQGLLLKTAVCPRCGEEGEVDIALERVTVNSKGQKQKKTVTRATYPGEVLRFLTGGSAG